MTGTIKACTAAVVALMAVTLPVASAQESDTAKALMERLEKLEKQNEDLQKQLQEQRALLRQQQEELRRRDPATAGSIGPDEDAVRKIVDGYLKSKDKPAEQLPAAPLPATDVGVPSAGDAGGRDLKMSVKWKDGFYAETADKAFSFHVGAQADFLAGWFDSSPQLSNSVGAFNNFLNSSGTGTGPGLNDGAELRRARTRFDAKFYDWIDAVFEVELANVIDERARTLGIPTTSVPVPPTTAKGQATTASAAPPAQTPATTPFDFDPSPTVRFTDVYMRFEDVPWFGSIKAGHQKEFLTFSNATSTRYLTFVEQPSVFEAFNDDYSYSLGLTVSHTYLDERAYYWFGFFRTTNPFSNDDRSGAFDVGDGRYAYDARLTFLPIWEDDGYYWAHVGGDYSYRVLEDDLTRFRAFPLVRTGLGFDQPALINTGPIFSRDGQQNFTIEYASAFGPLTLTAEYAGSVVRNAFTGGLPGPDGKLPAGVVAHGNYMAQGYYVEMLYFLTGDHRGYRREQPGYDRIHPVDPFFFANAERGQLIGRGAWEIGVRYDYLDLCNSGINGGFLHSVTAGLNWHLNANAKIQWAYVWMNRNFEPVNTIERVPGDLNAFSMNFHFDF
jgi:phosphate-selective porin OprO/OprP